MEWMVILAIPGAFAALAGVLCCRISRWCLGRQVPVLRIGVLAALAVLGAGLLYGLLRFGGAIRLPGDNTYSFNFFDATWRDDGMNCILLCVGPFAGLAASLVPSKKN